MSIDGTFKARNKLIFKNYTRTHLKIFYFFYTLTIICYFYHKIFFMSKQKKLSADNITDDKINSFALEAIANRYGSLTEGFMALLESREPSLIRFVFEHGIGKPREKIKIDVNKSVEHVQVIQLPNNNRNFDAETIQPISESKDADFIEIKNNGESKEG